MTQRILELLFVLHLWEDLHAAAVVQGAARIARVCHVPLPFAEILNDKLNGRWDKTTTQLKCGHFNNNNNNNNNHTYNNFNDYDNHTYNNSYKLTFYVYDELELNKITNIFLKV